MGKFKVGDRVRAIHRSGLGLFLAGKEYEVLGVRDEKITAINERGQRDSWGEDHFEHLPVAAQTFKVGDRVRLTANEGEGRDSGAIGVIEKITNDYARVLFDAPFNGWGETGRNWHAQLSRLLAAPLKIEAGKYYRTRDGRKVGPIADRGRYYCANEMHYNSDGECGLEGRHHPSQDWRDRHDLIDEWVDEPVKAAAPFPFILRNLEFTVAPIAKPAIVALIENGQPKPSVAPFVHANETLAAKEATRLANLQKGKEFGVYVLTQKASEPAPSYKHEWQRFAAKGEKISAIKELRSVTGLGLMAAKDAVEHWIAHDEPYSRIAA